LTTMSGDSGEFNAILAVVAFLAILWVFGRICKLISISPIIGWIASGMIFGPNCLGLIKEGESQVWKLLGTLGVTLMIAESGTHIHFDKIKKVGGRAVAVALIGTFCPLILGFGLVFVFGERSSSAAFAAGCSMAPTSVGVALKLLTEANRLNSLCGQTIVTAAFIDDVFSIILLVIMEALKESDGTMMGYVVLIGSKFVFCFLALAIGVLLAKYIFGGLIGKLLHSIPSYDSLNYQPRDEAHLVLMIIVLVSYSYIGDKIGSHLLGAFIAGISFSQVSRSMYVWRRQMKRLCQWLIKLFFACSVAFTIPISSLFSPKAFGQGLVFAVLAGVAGKLVSGMVCHKENRYTVGFAMVGRGEFAYLVAEKAKTLELISAELYATIVWALLLAVIAAPIAFGYVLKKKQQRERKARICGGGAGVKLFTIKAEARHHTGVHFEIVDVLHNLKLDILEAKVETDGDTDCSEFIVGVSGHNDFLDVDKISEILHDIREAVGDTEAQVQLLPIDEDLVSPSNLGASMGGTIDEDLEESSGSQLSPRDSEHLLEVKMLTRHCPQIFGQLIEEMEAHDLELVRGHMEDFLNTDSQVIFAKSRLHRNYRSPFIRETKQRLKGVLNANGVKGEILVKRIRRDTAVLPHHHKFSELLSSDCSQNPLLSNKIENGYEIDVCLGVYAGQQSLLVAISNVFDALDLDIRTIDAQIDEESQEFKASFFVQRRQHARADSIRDEIEIGIAGIFKTLNLAATIKTKEIAMGKNKKREAAIAETFGRSGSGSFSNIQVPGPAVGTSKNELKIPSPSISNTAQITETVTIVTPQHGPASAPPSIEKSEMTFNFIGVLDNGQIAVSRKASRPNTVDVLHEVDENNDADEDSERTKTHSSSGSNQASAQLSSCSIIDLDILT